MTIKQSLFLVLGICSLLSCKKENLDDCFRSTGKITEELRITDSFKSIEVEDRINLYLTQAKDQSVIVKAGKNLQEHIDLEVSDSTLFIKNNNRCNWVRSYKKEIDIYISLTNLKSIVYRGGGNINFTNQFEQPTLEINMWKASGKLDVNINCSHVTLNSHSGTADIACQGQTDKLFLYSNGNGYLNAENLISNKATAINKNSGRLILNVQNELKAEIRGSGNIEYIGSPLVELVNTGSGNLIQR